MGKALPSRGGLGGVVLQRPKRRASFPARRRRSPHKSTLAQTGGLWGEPTGPSGEGRPPGAPAGGPPQEGPPMGAPHAPGAAALRLACHQAQRLARQASGCRPSRTRLVPFRWVTSFGGLGPSQVAGDLASLPGVRPCGQGDARRASPYKSTGPTKGPSTPTARPACSPIRRLAKTGAYSPRFSAPCAQR